MKYIYTFLATAIYFLLASHAFAVDSSPRINCYGLPGCPDDNKAVPSKPNVSENSFTEAIADAISFIMPYVAIFAIIAVMISGVMYLISAGDEDKVNRAKKWIIWSLLWVLLSISSWFIIATLWQLNFNSSGSWNPATESPN